VPATARFHRLGLARSTTTRCARSGETAWSGPSPYAPEFHIKPLGAPAPSSTCRYNETGSARGQTRAPWDAPVCSPPRNRGGMTSSPPVSRCVPGLLSDPGGALLRQLPVRGLLPSSAIPADGHRRQRLLVAHRVVRDEPLHAGQQLFDFVGPLGHRVRDRRGTFVLSDNYMHRDLPPRQQV